MSPENDQSPTPSELRNKEETEIAIGESLAPESRAHSMWRCGECGEMGRLEDELPAECPDCGASREELFYWEED